MRSYTDAYNNTSGAIRERWEAFKTDQLQHQELESVANQFLKMISRDIDALYSDFIHDEIDGVLHPSQGRHRENQFLKKLCFDWRSASVRYQKSPEPVVQFFNSELDRHRRLCRIEMIGKDLQWVYMPEALNWSEDQLACLLGQYLANIKMLDELNEILECARAARLPSGAKGESTGSDEPDKPKKNQPDKMIGLKPAVIALHYILRKIYELEETPDARPEMKDLAEFMSVLPVNASSIATTLSKTWRSDTSELADVTQADFEKAGSLLRKLKISPDDAFLKREHPTR